METAQLTVVFLLLQAAIVEGRICPNSPSALTNGTIRNQGEVIYDTVRYGHYIELDCCASSEGGLSFTWMKWNKTSEQWQNYDPKRADILFYDNKRILSIRSSTSKDAGLYQCSVRSGLYTNGTVQFHLNVVACDKLARGPYPISPLPCKDTVANDKEVLTLPCMGYFGCAEDGDIRIVTWFVSPDKSKADDWKEASLVDKRYKQIDFQRDGGVVKGSNLTIVHVSDTDYNRKFMCLLASPQMLQGESRIFVTLNKDGDSSVFMAALTIGDVLVAVSILTFISLVLSIFMFALTIYQSCKKSKRNVENVPTREWISLSSNGIGKV